MEKVRILIVEDKLIIAEALKGMLEDMGYEVPAIFTSGKETLEHFRPGFADIIMMDIFLADNTNGVDTSIEIRKVSTAPVIFITDNTDEQLRRKAIYQANTVQYISKPFTKMDISIAIDLAIKAIKGQELTLNQPDNSSFLMNESIFVKDRVGLKKIMIADILYLMADGSYARLVYRNKTNDRDKEEVITFSENLSSLEAKLSFAKALVRIHRSYVINIDNVEKIMDGGGLWVGNKEIPVGKMYKHEISNRFRLI